MNNKILMIILVLQIRIIYCLFSNYYFGDDFDGINFDNIKIDIDILQQDESIFKEYKYYIENFIVFQKKILENLFKKNKYNHDEIKNYLNKNDYISYYTNKFQIRLASFKKLFKNLKNLKIWGIEECTKFVDYGNFIKFIDESLIKIKKLTQDFFSDPENVKSKSLYKKYIDELKLDILNETLKENYELILNIKGLSYNKYKSLSFINKFKILQKINKLNNDSKIKKGKNIKINYLKIYFDDCYESVSNINFQCKKIKIILNEELIEKIITEYDKLKEILNKLENDAKLIDISLRKTCIITEDKINLIINNEKSISTDYYHFDFNLENPVLKQHTKLTLEINQYKKNVDEFLNSLNTIFSLLNQEIGNESKNPRDFGYLYFLQNFKNILLKPRKIHKIQKNINVITELFFGDNTSKLTIGHEMGYYWFFDLPKFFFMNHYNDLINLLDSFNELNKFIFFDKNKPKFQESIGKELTDNLESLFNLYKLYSSYINTEDYNERKKMEIEVFTKIFFFKILI